MKIFVDGDGSPVKADVFEIGAAFGLEVVVVTSVAHFSVKKVPSHVSFIYVDKGADAADFRVLSEISSEDILITQDYGLASIALAKKAIVLHHLGFEYTSENIDILLANRYLGQLARKAGQKTKGHKVFSREDRDDFGQVLIRVIQRKNAKKHEGC